MINFILNTKNIVLQINKENIMDGFLLSTSSLLMWLFVNQFEYPAQLQMKVLIQPAETRSNSCSFQRYCSLHFQIVLELLWAFL